MTKTDIDEALARAADAATEWADAQPEFAHIWNGVVARVTVDGVLHEADFTQWPTNAAEISSDYYFEDPVTGLEIECECMGGS